MLLILAGLLLISCAGTAQNFENLDFEYGVYKLQPRKWMIEGEAEMYDARLDSTTAKSGFKSLYVTVKKGMVYTFLSIPGKAIAGKNVQIEGYIKFKTAGSLTAMLAFHNPNDGNPNVSKPITGNANEWISVSHQASFPVNYSSDRLLIALIGSGTGDFWFDDVRIKINGQVYGNGSPDFRKPTIKEITLLNKQAISIKSLDPDSNSRDLDPLVKIIGNANIIALGENSHGSASIFKLKLRMVQYMIEKMGFSIFALEAPVAEADKINDYVLYGKGTLKDVAEYLTYPSWQTTEMIDIVQWIKYYNEKTGSRVEFKGFDMQHSTSAFKAVEDFARVNDTSLLLNLGELKKGYDSASHGKQQREKVYQKAETIFQYLLSKNTSASAGVDTEHLSRVKHYMNVYVQSLSLEYKLEGAKSRDEYMAHNIDWLFKANEGKKIIVSADNTHVTKASGKMGNYLNRWFGKKYLVFGFTYNTGSYSAYGPEKYYDVHPSYEGTYEYFFSKSRFKNFFLDLRNTGHIPILNSRAGFRSIGSRPQKTTQFAEINLKEHFDAIVYMESTTHTTLLSESK